MVGLVLGAIVLSLVSAVLLVSGFSAYLQYSVSGGIAPLLGGRNQPMPATAIIGYPPTSTGPKQIAAQTDELVAKGWRRFEAAVSGSEERTAERLCAVRSSAPGCWVDLDGSWVFDSVEDADRFAHSIADVGLGWFEGVFPPGDASIVAKLRRRAPVYRPTGGNDDN